MKTCSRCKIEKSLDQFSWKSKNKGIKSAYCKPCNTASSSDWYQRNKVSHIARVTRESRDRRNAAYQAISDMNLKCSKCSENHPAALDFHHTDPSIKDGEVSTMISWGRPWLVIEKEISKCIVLCANCHRKHHWNERYGPVAQ